MLVKDILGRKGVKLVTTRPKNTVEAAAALLVSNNIGALPVRDDTGKLVGVISERDVVHAFARDGGKVLSLLVEDLMTHDVVVCAPDDTVKEAMRRMARCHIRHLPVVDDGGLCGIISQRDVMEFRLEETEMERNVLRDYAMTR